MFGQVNIKVKISGRALALLKESYFEFQNYIYTVFVLNMHFILLLSFSFSFPPNRSLGILLIGSECVPFCTDLWVPLVENFISYGKGKLLEPQCIRV